MALAKCIYCSELISEHAVQCPKCRKSEPFNRDLKRRTEDAATQQAALEVKRNRALSKHYTCPECGDSSSPYKTVLESMENNRKYSCSKCGYPSIVVSCELCNSAAIDYDPHRDKFVCRKHLVVKCDRCKKLIFDHKDTYQNSGFCGSGSSLTNYHWSCSPGTRHVAEKIIEFLFSLVLIGLVILWIAHNL